MTCFIHSSHVHKAASFTNNGLNDGSIVIVIKTRRYEELFCWNIPLNSEHSPQPLNQLTLDQVLPCPHANTHTHTKFLRDRYAEGVAQQMIEAIIKIKTSKFVRERKWTVISF